VFREQGEYEQAKLHYQRVLQIDEKALGADHPNVAMTLTNLGNVFREQGEYEQAKLHHQRALQIMEEVMGADHPNVASSLNNLGNVSREQGEYEQAKLHYQRALQIEEKALGANHPQLASSLMGLAEIALAQEQFDLARTHAERAFSILQAGEVAPERLAEARFLLARALWAADRSQRTRARELAEQARDPYAELGGAKEEALAEVQGWLAEHEVDR
jgi:tetratricopeptide (TPR) repeat protein